MSKANGLKRASALSGVLLLLAVGACSGDDTISGTSGSSSSGGTDSGAKDSTVDSPAADTGTDSSPADTGADVAADTGGSDAGSDSSDSSAADSSDAADAKGSDANDAGVDTGTDSGPETGPDGSDGSTSTDAGDGGEGGACLTTFNVTANGTGAYTINGVDNPTLDVCKGQTVTFNLNANGHPFWLKTIQGAGTANAYTDGVTGNGNSTTALTWVVASTAPALLYYNCEFHGAMTGNINVH